MLYRIGRFLQLLGLIILPIAMAGNLARGDQVDSRVMLAIASVGVGVFVLGWLLQKGSHPGQ